jgi:predicted GH43/DUF377 family glycosyl hydrolase
MSSANKSSRRKPLAVKRLPVTFASDNRRVITRFFDPGSKGRMQNIVERIAQLDDEEVARLLDEVFQRFRTRHGNIVSILEQNFRNAAVLLGNGSDIDLNRRLLLGSYFTMEYSIESAALFNPSIVPHRNQNDLPQGAVRFIMSLRATGEGHVSSIVFRTGIIYSDQRIQVDPLSRHTSPISVVPDKQFDKTLFARKLRDIRVPQRTADLVMDRLPPLFTMTELEQMMLCVCDREPDPACAADALEGIRWLAKSNYRLKLPADAEASELVIFPQTINESRGMEDLRLVRFVHEDGAVTYFGTCTAYDGFRTLPELIETSDFHTIGVHTLNGAKALNKGLALFPRKIDGNYVMCSRIDGENLYIMRSDNVHFWETADLLQTPKQPWEFVQIGNCGSPLETSEGWILLTHGVGPMRTYCIGAMLLDRDDPQRIIGALDEPLIVPTEKERDGYVPNVAYTCGAMIHRDQLYIPFATSDTTTRFGMVSVERLLDRLTS